MEILYIARVGRQLDGVKLKISNTIREWRSLGHNVSVYNTAESKRGVIATYIYDRKLKKEIYKNKPSIIYWRFGPIPLLQKFDKNITIIVESNSNIESEKTTRNLLTQLLINLYMFKFRKVCKGVVGVTSECIVGFESIPNSAIIGNGVSLNKKIFSDSIQSKKRNKNLKTAVFLGSPGCPWHGLDKITSIASKYPEIQFNIIGYNNPEPLVSDCSNIAFKGYLKGESLSDELIKADFAIGSLAMERAGMSESSSLKNRTYLQYALPIIIQGKDKSLAGYPGIFELPMQFSKQQVDDAIKSIISFSYKDKDYLGLLDRIDTKSIEEKRLDFFKGLAFNNRK